MRGQAAALTAPALPTTVVIDGPDVSAVGACEKWSLTTMRTGSDGVPVNADVLLDTPVTITGGGGVTLWASSDCSTTPLGTSLGVKANSHSASFWVTAAAPSKGTLAATAVNLDGTSAAFAFVNPGVPVWEGVTSPTPIAVGACVAATAKLQDSNYFSVVGAAAYDVPLWTDRSGVTFFLDRACSSPTDHVTIPAGRGSARFWLRSDSAQQFSLYTFDISTRRVGYTLRVDAGIATALVIRGPATMGPSQCKAFTLKAFSSDGALTPVAVDTSIALGGAGQGAFYSDSACASSTSTATLVAGKYQRNVYFKDPAVEQLTLTASGLGSTATLPLLIAAPTRVSVAGDPLIAAGTVGRYTATLQAVIGGKATPVASDQPVTLNLVRSAGDGIFCSQSNCAAGSEITSLPIPAGSTSATFYFKQDTPPASDLLNVTLTAVDAAAVLTSYGFVTAVVGPSAVVGLRVSVPTGYYANDCVPVTVTPLNASGRPITTSASITLRIPQAGSTTVYTNASCTNPNNNRSATLPGNTPGVTFYLKDTAIESLTLNATGTYTLAGTTLNVKGSGPATFRGATRLTGGVFTPSLDARQGLCKGIALQVVDGAGNGVANHAAFSITLIAPADAEIFTDDSCGTSITPFGTTLDVPANVSGVTFGVRYSSSHESGAQLWAAPSLVILDATQASFVVHALTSVNLAPSAPQFVEPGGAVTFTATGSWSDGWSQDVSGFSFWDTVGELWRSGATFTAGGDHGTAALSFELYGVVAPWVPFFIGAPLSAALAPLGTHSVGETVSAVYTGTWLSPSSQPSPSACAATFSSDHPEIASVDPTTGLVTAVSGGVATITGIFKGVPASAPITVLSPNFALQPAALRIPLGTSGSFGAITDNGTDIRSLATWTSSDPSVATVAGGTVTSVSVGAAVITASYQGHSASAPINVTAKTVQSIAVAPIDKLTVGTSAPLAVTASYSDGSTGDVSAQVDWISSSGAIAWVSTAAHRVIGQNRGTATLSASYAGKTATLPVEVWSLQIPNLTSSGNFVQTGTARQATATLTSPASVSSDATALVQWSVDYTPATTGYVVATVSSSGLVSGVATGGVSLHAWFAPGSGYVGSARVPVVVAASPVAPVLQSMRFVADDEGDLARPTPLGRSDVIHVRAFGTASTGGVVTTAEMTEGLSTWTSTAPSTVASLGSGWFAALTAPSVAGGVEVRASGAQLGYSGVTASAWLRTVSAPVSRIDLTPSWQKVPLGAQTQYLAKARYADGTTADATSIATWSASDPAVTLSAGVPVACTGTQPGTFSVSASLSGTIGSGTLVVSPATLGNLAVTPATATIVGRGSAQLLALGSLSDGDLLDLTQLVQWSSADTNSATVGNLEGGGLCKGAAPTASALVAISADYTGLVPASASAQLTLVPAQLLAITVTTPGISDASLLVGDTLGLASTATWSDGPSTDITQTSNWTSSDPTILSVIDFGLIECLAPGTATISASQGGVSGSIVLKCAVP